MPASWRHAHHRIMSTLVRLRSPTPFGLGWRAVYRSESCCDLELHVPHTELAIKVHALVFVMVSSPIESLVAKRNGTMTADRTDDGILRFGVPHVTCHQTLLALVEMVYLNDAQIAHDLLPELSLAADYLGLSKISVCAKIEHQLGLAGALNRTAEVKDGFFVIVRYADGDGEVKKLLTTPLFFTDTVRVLRLVVMNHLILPEWGDRGLMFGGRLLHDDTTLDVAGLAHASRSGRNRSAVVRVWRTSSPAVPPSIAALHWSTPRATEEGASDASDGGHEPAPKRARVGEAEAVQPAAAAPPPPVYPEAEAVPPAAAAPPPPVYPGGSSEDEPIELD